MPVNAKRTTRQLGQIPAGTVVRVGGDVVTPPTTDPDGIPYVQPLYLMTLEQRAAKTQSRPYAATAKAAGFPGYEDVGPAYGTQFTVIGDGSLSTGYWATTSNGQVIENTFFNNRRILVRHSDVVFRNCVIFAENDLKVDMRGKSGDATPLRVLFEDCEVYGKTIDSGTGIGYGNYTANRCYIHYVEDAFRAGPNVTITNCLTDEQSTGLLSDTTGERLHTDGVQFTGAANAQDEATLIQGNSLFAYRTDGSKGNSAIIVGCETTDVRNVTITGNFLANGSYSLYLKGEQSGHFISNVNVYDNVYARDALYGEIIVQPAATGYTVGNAGLGGTSATNQPVRRDNFGSSTPVVTAAYDMIVTSVSLVDSTVASGGFIRPQATVKNQGTAAVPSGTIIGVLFSVNGTGTVWSDTYTSGLAAGASVTMTANGGGTSGTFARPASSFTLEGYVDNVNRFPNEADKTNNKTAVTIPAPPGAPAQANVSGLTGSFDQATRKATVTWAAPTTGNVTLTRTDNLGNTGSTTVAASSGTYTFSTAIAAAATSVTLQVKNTAGNTAQIVVQTPQPTSSTPEMQRQALLGIATGATSHLPFNSGVNPSGRNSGFGSPDGYEYLNDVIEGSSERGVPFDVRAGFQYQNRNVSEGSTAWNDLKGMQVLDWFDDTKVAILGMEPFPAGGSYTAAKNGTYDAQLVAIGQTIAAKRPAGKGKVGLRLAWEMNGNWYTGHGAFNSDWSPVADYVAGSQRIITKIREGAGDRVFFIQCWSASTNTRYQSTYWGDSYCDVIGVDVYDAFAGTTNGIHTQAQLLATGLGGMFQFARDHGKLVGLDEWGGHNTASEASNGNDNPDFPGVVYDWLYANRDAIAYECQFNDNATGNVENNLWNTGVPVQLPNQRAAYIAKVKSLRTP